MSHDHTSGCSTTQLFRYLWDYRILICLAYNYAVPPTNLRNHVRTHRRELGNKSAGGRVCATMKGLSSLDLLDPTCETVRFPLPTDLPIPDLPVFDGHACVVCSFATRQLSSMENHQRQLHPSGRKPGRPSACAPSSSSAPPHWLSA